MNWEQVLVVVELTVLVLVLPPAGPPPPAAASLSFSSPRGRIAQSTRTCVPSTSTHPIAGRMVMSDVIRDNK